MKKTLVTVGFHLPDPDIEHLLFKSNDSILGADAVLFCPNMAQYGHEYGDGFAGRTLISQSDSAELRDHTRHWLSELSIFLQSGKTVFLFLLGLDDFFVHTGRKEVSGTGRSQHTTNIVDSYPIYSAIPIPELSSKVHKSSGNLIKPTEKLGTMSTYWYEFGEYSYYEVYLDEMANPSLVTQTGNKAVGGVIRFKNWKGTIVLLPLVDLESMAEDREKELRKRTGKKSTLASTAKTKKSVGKQFVSALFQIDRAVRAHSERTPAPQWSTGVEYALQEETTLAKEIASIEQGIAKLREAGVAAKDKLETATRLKGLLYETGAALESAVLEAIRLLGFKAENYRDNDSEFDVLFIDPHGARLLGEAEGKTDKSVNIDKLDQLNRNVQEEFAKREDATYSKGVLFGNAFRLKPLSERGEFFTPKCIAGAARLGFALVRTPDLFPAAKYLKENPDENFAEACRSVILGTSGKVVEFPPTPTSSTQTQATGETYSSLRT